MPATHRHETRRRHKRTDDGKGDRRMIAGIRFRTPGVSGALAAKRFNRIDDVWADNQTFCAKFHSLNAHWTPTALWAAEFLRKGEFQVPLPPVNDILVSFGEGQAPFLLQLILQRHTTDDLVVDELDPDESIYIHDLVSEHFPSVNWVLPRAHAEAKITRNEGIARWSLEQLAKAKNQPPPDPETLLITGMFHEALAAYEEKRRADFTEPDGTFDGSGHHFLGIIKGIRERRPDFQLAELDFRKCQEEYDYWCDRPDDRRKNKQGNYLTRKTCQNYVGELGRFFEWLHLTNEFGWRKPADFSSLKRKVRALKTDRRSVQDMEIKTFSIDDLKLLYRHAVPFERLLIAWCLNCAHGAAEMGRVEWRDVYLLQEHPWKSQGLNIDSTKGDSWCGFTRPKSDVLGWWWLWPETVQLIDWWRGECKRNMRREPRPNERILLTKTGACMYRDASRNAQSTFSNTWRRLKNRIKSQCPDVTFSDLPFGTLRDQFPDWLGGDRANALVASVALCHGVPHKGDRLLYKHYANRPWGELFRAQRDYRRQLKPVFAAVPNPLDKPDPLGEKIRALWLTGVRNPKTIAQCLNISAGTAHRRVNELGLR